MKYLLLPSILSADLTKLGDEIEAVIKAGADMIHFDVMDNHYVPNLTLGPFVCVAIKKRFKDLKIDVHLMVQPVDALIKAFADAGVYRISIHPDATTHLDRSLAAIREQGCLAGLALNPAQSPECLKWVQHRLDFVLIMTVNPGFAGQKMIPAVLDKIRIIHQQFPQIPISVDGGMGLATIIDAAKAGASAFVAGSAIFSTSDYQKTIKDLRLALSTA